MQSPVFDCGLHTGSLRVRLGLSATVGLGKPSSDDHDDDDDDHDDDDDDDDDDPLTSETDTATGTPPPHPPPPTSRLVLGDITARVLPPRLRGSARARSPDSESEFLLLLHCREGPRTLIKRNARSAAADLPPLGAPAPDHRIVRHGLSTSQRTLRNQRHLTAFAAQFVPRRLLLAFDFAAGKQTRGSLRATVTASSCLSVNPESLTCPGERHVCAREYGRGSGSSAATGTSHITPGIPQASHLNPNVGTAGDCWGRLGTVGDLNCWGLLWGLLGTVGECLDCWGLLGTVGDCLDCRGLSGSVGELEGREQGVRRR
eukprot:3387699-Rhodomonas_salina.1